MTFGEWMDFWYQNYCKIRIKESTQEGYETRIYNHFKDAVPEFKFKNTPTEEYNEGISYVLRVEASEKEENELTIIDNGETFKY